MRYIVASLVLLPVWRWRGAQRPALRELPAIGAMGLLGFSVYNLCVNAGEQTVTAGTAALIAASIPVMKAIGARWFFGERVSLQRWTGVLTALLGVGIIAAGAEGGVKVSAGALLVLVASVCASAYTLLTKKFVARYGALEVTTWSIWAGTIGLIPAGGGLPAQIQAAPSEATATVFLLGLIPGALCYTLFAYALARMPVAKIASWMYGVPVAAVGFGWWLLHELPPPAALVGGAVTLSGVWLANRTR
jgi:drug/metabolite transporter (DMT)-like permease